MKMYLKDREVYVSEVHAYAQDVVDCYILKAEFADNSEPLTDDELAQIEQKYPEFMYEKWLDNKISAIDFMD